MHDPKFLRFSHALLAFGLLLSLAAGYAMERFWQEKLLRAFQARSADLFELAEQRLTEYETKLKTVYSHYEANRILAKGGLGQYLKRLRLQNYPGLLQLDLVSQTSAWSAANPPFGEEWAWLSVPAHTQDAPVLLWHVPLYPVGAANYDNPSEAVETRFDLAQLFGDLFQKIRLGELQAQVYVEGDYIAGRFNRYAPAYATAGADPAAAGEFWAEQTLPFAATVLRLRLYAPPAAWLAHGPGLAVAALGGLLNLLLIRVLRNHHARLLQAHERAVALYERGEAVAFIAHELPQPLTGVIGCVEGSLARLKAGQAPPEILLRDLEQARASAMRAHAFLSDINTHLRQGQPADALAPLAVAHLLRDVAALARLDPRMRGIALHVGDCGAELRVMASAIALEMVLLNLLRNAAEAISDADQGGAISLAAATEDGQLVLRVSDDGPGLARPEVLFQPFKSGKAYGAGLGLVCCQWQVERRFGGTLSGANRPQGGACFTITLPLWAG
ncbi:MAG: sensor histidine kinase [Candidatus Methylumidiphilus sp.]